MTAEPPGERRAPARNSTDVPDPTWNEDRPGIGASPLLLSLMPFVLLFLLYVVVPAYGAPVFAFGESAFRIISLAIGVAWAAFGTYLASEAQSFGIAVLVLLTCSLPASVVIVLAPFA